MLKLHEAVKLLPPELEVLEVAPIGSAYILSPEEASDLDVLLLVEDATSSALLLCQQGFVAGGSNAPGPDQDSWWSLTKDRLNIIVCDDRDYFNLWKMATAVCKYLKVRDKNQRIDIHGIIMDGYEADDIRLLAK